MGLIIKEHIDNDCLLGVWEIAEDYNSLFSRLSLLPEDLQALEDFKNPLRKIEWLSVRVLLNEITNKNLSIVYNGSRKPFIKDRSYNISISHSRNLTSVLLSEKKKVGLDLEYMSHRINKIASRFINDEEVITENDCDNKFHLYIHWCAKEALYKICDKQDINFKKNLTIEPFKPGDRGLLYGRVNNRYINERFKLSYFTIDNYVIVWTTS